MNEPNVTSAQRRRIFLVLFMAILVTMTGVGIIAPYLPIYARELGASGTMIGLIFGAFSMARLVTMPIFGRWSDRRGRKVFIAVGFLFYALASVGFILATTSVHLMLVRIMQGASAAMILPIAMAYVGEISEKNHEARSMNSINIALFLGFGIGPLTGGLIHDSHGIWLNFAALGLASLLAFLVVLVFLPNLRPASGRDSGTASSRYRDILANNVMRGVFLYRLSNAVGRGALMSFLPLLASEKLGLSAIQIGLIISCNLMLSGLLQTFFGKLADRVDRRVMAVAGNLMAAATLVMIPYARDFTELFLINLGMGVTGAVTIPATSGIVVTEGRKFAMGAVMALFNIAMSIGLAAGPVVGGVIKDMIGITEVFHFASATAIAGTVLFVIFLRRRPL